MTDPAHAGAPQDHRFEPNAAVPVSCKICGYERRFHQDAPAHAGAPAVDLDAARALADIEDGRRQRQNPHARPARFVRGRHGRQAADLRGVDRMTGPTCPVCGRPTTTKGKPNACGLGYCPRLESPPKALDSIVDVVLAYRPKAKSKPARRRKRRAAKIAKEK